jgi:hypothetical protein
MQAQESPALQRQRGIRAASRRASKGEHMMKTTMPEPNPAAASGTG